MRYLQLLFLLMLVPLAGCITTTADKSFKFDASNKKGLIAIPNPSSRISGDIRIVGISALDFSKKLFTGGLRACSSCFVGEDIFNLANENAKFKLIALDPGVYALHEVLVGPNHNYIVYKFCKGSYAFEVEPGTVSFVPIDSPNGVNLTDLKEAITVTTSIKAPVSKAKILAPIKYNCERGKGTTGTHFTLLSKN